MIAFDNFGPYHMARLNAAARELEVLALEYASTSALYAWDSPQTPAGLRRAVLTRGQPLARRSELFAALDLNLASFRPQAVAVPGWSSRMALALSTWCAERRIPVIAMSETNSWDFPRRALPEFVKRRIFEHFTAGLCSSKDQAGYLSALGLPADSIFRGYNVVDNDHFARLAIAAQDRQMPAGENGLPLPETARGKYFLASSRFISKKNLHSLLAAYAQFRSARDEGFADWPLILLGDGDLRGALEKQRDDLGLNGFVHMPGFRQYDELPAYYGTAGCFVHASTVEQWGLVVNEAMAAGLPVIVSNRCGCVSELVQDGVNGFAFAPDNPQQLVDAMRRIVSSPDRGAMCQASKSIIANWAPSRFGKSMANAARYAVTASRPNPTRLARIVHRLVMDGMPAR